MSLPGGIGFTEAFRTTEHQTDLYNDYLNKKKEWGARSWYQKLGRTPPVPAYAPGTSAHEAGMAFDLPGKYVIFPVIAIFEKHGFSRSVDNDPIHFQWRGWNNLSGEKQAELIRAAQAYYSRRP